MALEPNHRLTAGEVKALIEAAKLVDPAWVNAGEADGTDLRWLKTALAKLERQLELLE